MSSPTLKIVNNEAKPAIIQIRALSLVGGYKQN